MIERASVAKKSVKTERGFGIFPGRAERIHATRSEEHLQGKVTRL